MTELGRRLFASASLRHPLLAELLAQSAATLKQRVNEIDAAEFARQSDENIAELVGAKAAFKALEVPFDKAKLSVEEVHHNNTVKASKSIPYFGDSALWQAKSERPLHSPPKAEVRGQAVVVGVEVSAVDIDQAKGYLDKATTQLAECLTLQAKQIDRHNAALPRAALPFVKERRKRLVQLAYLSQALGV